MTLARRTVSGLVCCIILLSLPLLAIRRGDTGSSKDGLLSNCPPTVGYANGVCPVLNPKGTAVLSGKDQSGNAVTVTITLYDWGYYPCSATSCQKQPIINYAILDVVLTGTDTAGIESLVVKGVLPNPGYVSCGGVEGTVGVGCIYAPEPDNNSDVQEPTPISGADNGTNTRWDFGGIPPANPPLPAIPFDQLACNSDGYSNICDGSPLGEAVLVVTNSVESNKLGTAASNYLVTLIDGTQLGTLSIPASATPATNNTQATAKVITAHRYKDYADTSQTYPQMNPDGSPSYPQDFALAPVPPQSSPAFPSCYLDDTRTFRTVWYTYTAPSNGSITITTAFSRYDTLIYVFTGSPSQPTAVSCDDDPQGGHLLQAETTFNATESTTYQIVVYETPTFQAESTGYPLSVDGTLYFNFQFSTIAPTTITTVTSSPNPSIFGELVKFTAKVTSKRPGILTGAVTFSEGPTTLGTSMLIGGSATLSAVPLTTGTNSVTASYSGDSNFSPSSASMSQVVNQAKTTLAVTSNQNPSSLGQAVTFTAVITPQYSGLATGTVIFNDGATTLGTATVSGNSASLTTTALTLGSNSITASYGGDSNFKGSTSKALPQVVIYGSTTMLASSLNPSISGNPITFTVTVTSPEGTPKGTVEIMNGSTVLAALTVSAGSAQYTTSQLGVGSNIITAVYSGDSKIGGSASSPINQVVMFPSNFSILHSFGAGTDGADPVAGLVQDAQGNMYGTTRTGGANGEGSVFKIDSAGNETILYSFTGTNGDGAFPQAGLVLDTQGNLYGTTDSGGANGDGTVFQVTATGTESVLYAFKGGADGANPQAGLVRDAQANLYGTTYNGGNQCGYYYGCGTVFRVTATGQETVLYSFTGTGADGSNPAAGLVEDAQGNLYGTTYHGGTGGAGTVFEVTAAGQEIVLYGFTGYTGDGAYPAAGLVLDASGNLYGTAYYGGNFCSCGTVFKVTPTGTESTLYFFTGGVDGSNPQAGLVFDAQGNLYGTTYYGGNRCESYNGCGTVFEINAAGQETVLYSFSGTGGDGANPASNLLLDKQENIYGTTTSGGTSLQGTVFKLSPQ